MLAQQQAHVWHVVILAGVAIAVWWYAIRQARRARIPPQFWCYFLYLLGTVGLIVAWMREPGMNQGANAVLVPKWPLFAVAAGFLFVGLLVHATLWFAGRVRHEEKERSRLWIFVTVIAGTIIMEILRSRGLAHWVTYGFAAFAILVVLVLVLFVIVSYLQTIRTLRRSPVNQMAHLIQAGTPDKAAELGESVGEEARTDEVEVNLGVAYCLSGQGTEGRAIFETLNAREDLPEPIAELVREWLAKTSSDNEADIPEGQ